ncbi:MAG: N-acetylglucosamine-specific PTS transporter subunit IIBC [Niameybacter sp.]|uniref:N-acetylglucosamine-specific PTS transporter subunit IIBC n=1 Tax=Niameybacter sp. TaxID=2033640 RepID=UPI002FCA35FC
MMKYLQKLGKSLMLPVACLPVAGILMGIGYAIDPNIMITGDANVIATFLVKAGGALIDNMAILFAIGVGIGMADDKDGTSALAALVSWLMITKLLSTGTVAALTGMEANAAFGKIENQFIGILAGIIGAACYNKFKNTKLPDFLSFFSGKRCVAIVTATVSLVMVLILFFVWPILYTGLVSLGKAILSTGAVGAGIYAFLNRLLIPVGLHHALNSVFWFDVAGINDLGNFWAGTGTRGVTGMYMSGFFPVMMFGLPAAALAMYHTAKDNKKKVAFGLLSAAALCSFFTGVTEPLEFAFMFLAPVLYLIHAILTGISAFVVALLPVRAGFNFSAGLVDLILSLKVPMAMNPLMLIPIGLGFGVVYYAVFRFFITKFNLKTPGREDDDIEDDEMKATLSNNDYTAVAKTILEGLGGKGNVASIDNCITRLRLEIKDYTLIDEKKIKAAGARGVMRPSKTSVQIIIGTQVQFVADELTKLCK